MTPPAFLIGQEPFLDLEGWRADAALCARQNLKSKEADDPFCSQVISMLDGLGRDEWMSALLSPEIFAFIVAEPEPWNWSMLSMALDARKAVSRSAVPWVWARPSEKFAAILRKQGEGSRSSSSTRAQFIDPDSAEFQYSYDLAQDALRLLDSLTPGFAADIGATVDRIALVDGRASFRGASGLGFRGMIMLSPDPTWTVGLFAEEIVHESTHCLLDLISVREPLLTGADAFEAVWDAPFRPDRRPLFGNFHAVVVVARLIHLFNALHNAGVDSAVDWKARAEDYAKRSIAAVDALAAYPELSPMARALLDMLVVPTICGSLSRQDPG